MNNSKSKVLRLGIAGLGTVGRSVVELLQQQLRLLTARTHCDIQITRIANRSQKPDAIFKGLDFTDDIISLSTADNVDVVVELMGGADMALQLVEQSLNNGKHVVTANKALLATHGNHLFDIASTNNVSLLYEAAVAGTIPIIRVLRDGLSANTISLVAGVINGTSNYILTAMEQQQWSFQDALSKAQQLGYAEADPSADINGSDAAHKLALMAALAFDMQVDFDGIYREGIDHVDIADISMAKELNYRIKHLGIASCHNESVSLRVHPALIANDELISSIDGALNAVMVKGSHSGITLHSGAGAGGAETAASVVADLVEIARGVNSSGANKSQLKVIPFAQMESAFYLRLSLIDEPGALNKLTGCFSQHGINLKSVIQRQTTANQVAVILITDVVNESVMTDMIERVRSLLEVQNDIVSLRIADFAEHK